MSATLESTRGEGTESPPRAPWSLQKKIIVCAGAITLSLPLVVAPSAWLINKLLAPQGKESNAKHLGALARVPNDACLKNKIITVECTLGNEKQTMTVECIVRDKTVTLRIDDEGFLFSGKEIELIDQIIRKDGGILVTAPIGTFHVADADFADTLRQLKQNKSAIPTATVKGKYCDPIMKRNYEQEREIFCERVGPPQQVATAR